MKPTIRGKKLLPANLFGFHERHSTIHQIHHLVDFISFSLEKKQYCSTVFIEVAQVFDHVWYPGLLLKLRNTFSF